MKKSLLNINQAMKNTFLFQVFNNLLSPSYEQINYVFWELTI